MPKPPGAVVRMAQPAQRGADTPGLSSAVSFPPAPDFRIG
jgi:hypothetical protein